MKSFDYIIIGAGSTGCVLTNRLSEDQSNSVLLLEAGGRDIHPYIHIPGAYSHNHKTKHDWGFETEPQKHLNNRVIYIPRGKVMGGCSSTNAMAYVRGNRKDYDQWAALGNEGWAFDDVLRYFNKSEKYIDIKTQSDGWRGTEGSLLISEKMAFRSPYGDAFIEACKSLGLPYNYDYNGKSQKGVGPFQFTIANGKRQSGATAFIKPILKRKNLTISTKSFVEKIIIKNDVAKGVSFRKGGTTHELSANKEIILCAGAIQSPQILMLSGIGEKSNLEKKGIEVILDLPGVGKNLQDHLFFGVSVSTKEQEGLNHSIPILGQLKALGQYVMAKSGPLMSSPLESVAFLNIDNPNEAVNFQLHFTPLHFGGDYDFDIYDINSLPKNDGFSILPTLLHPKSRGFIDIKSKDPNTAPLIQPNFLSEEQDLLQLLNGAKLALEIINQADLSVHVDKIMSPLDHTDCGLISHIKKTLETVYHPVGTCKMGNDEMSVVDPQLRIHGISNLRVADASIMPTITSGNTNAPCFMIGEKASDLIIGKNSEVSS